MAKIAFILRCHKDPEAIFRQAEMLTAAGDYMAIHFDARAKPEAFNRIKTALADNPSVTFARKRIKCGWGAWALGQAPLYAVEAPVAGFPRASPFFMSWGVLPPTKWALFALPFLDNCECTF
ncbi:MAG: glycosyl transferase, partial [Rhodobiaceae bacterium]|nr:glycosyl transferase [Rhodobiaceae bacterium]